MTVSDSESGLKITRIFFFQTKASIITFFCSIACTSPDASSVILGYIKFSIKSIKVCLKTIFSQYLFILYSVFESVIYKVCGSLWQVKSWGEKSSKIVWHTLWTTSWLNLISEGRLLN